MHRLKRLFRRTSTVPLTPTPTNGAAAGAAGASAPPLPRPPSATPLGGGDEDIPPLSSSVRRPVRRRTAAAAAARGAGGRPPRAAGVSHPTAAAAPPAARAVAPIPTETRPLKSIAELLSWAPDSVVDAALGCKVPLPAWAAARHGRLRSRRRLMLIHDFAGGFPPWEARPGGVGLPRGGDCSAAAVTVGRGVPPKGNPPPPARTPVLAGDPNRDRGNGRGPPVHWRFAHWAYVDVFVTFSHARVSVPPAGATAAAHRHGALSLGTVLFEWADGAADLRAVIGGPLSRRAEGVVALGRLAAARGFDGWLLNVEVDGLAPAEAAALRAWVADLTAAVHATVGAHGAVVWYEAVTAAGSLRYQNGLTPANAPFFTAAGGGLLTNYAWDSRGPAASAAAAAAAGRPPADVYMGVDVHGRGTYGGGGWGVATAVRAAAAAGVSVGVFAPAWTVEGDGGPGGCATSAATLPAAQATAAAREARLWTGPPGPAAFGSSAVAAYVRERPVLCGLPFGTDWDPGWGDGPPWVAGVRQSLPSLQQAADGTAVGGDGRSGGGGSEPQTGRWFCMARQAVQASFLRTVHAGGLATEAPAGRNPTRGGRRGGVGPALGGVRLCMDTEEAWSGGASVRVAFPPARVEEGEDVLESLPPPDATGKAAPEQGEFSAERVASGGREDARDLTASPAPATPGAVPPPPPPLRLTATTAASTATRAFPAAAPESPFALLRLLVASAPFSASGTPLTVAYTLRGTPAASARSGLALLFTHPISLVFLVAADSAWTAASQSALSRVRVHGRAAEVVVVPPSTAVAVGPAAATPDGAAWTRRVYDLPATVVAGRTLVEVLVLVGEPPLPPPTPAPPPPISGGGVTSGSTPPSRPTLAMSPPQWTLATPSETPPLLPRRMPSTASSLGEHSSGGGSELSVARSSRASARSASIRITGGGVRLGSRRATVSARVLSLSGASSRRGGGGGRGASSAVSYRRLLSLGSGDEGGESVADVAAAAASAVAAVDRRAEARGVAAITRRSGPAEGAWDDGASTPAAAAARGFGGAGSDGDGSGRDAAVSAAAAAQRRRLMSTPALLRGSRGWSIDPAYGEGVTRMGLADLRRAIEVAMARGGGGATAGRSRPVPGSAAAATTAAMSATGSRKTAAAAAARHPNVVGSPTDLPESTPAVPPEDPLPEVDPPEAAVIHIGTLSMAVTRRGGGGGGRPLRGAAGRRGRGGGGGGSTSGGGRRSQMPLPPPPPPPPPPAATLPGKAPGGVGRVAERGRLGSGSGSGSGGGGGGGGGGPLPPPP